MTRHLLTLSTLALAVVIMPAGCALDAGDHPEPGVAISLTSKGGFFADNLPVAYQAQPSVDAKGLAIDAGGKQRLFPMPRAVREFDSHSELVAFATETLGATPILDGQKLVGFTTYTSQVGHTFWIDETSGAVYRVTSPVLALLGGASGRVIVDGELVCLDGGASCKEGLPAGYLEPVKGGLKRAADLDVCEPSTLFGGRFCAHFHSFFNKFDSGIYRWARLGGNTRVTEHRGGTAWSLGGVRVCDEDDPGAFDLGAVSGRPSLFVCFDYTFEALPPEERAIRVMGPFVAAPSGAEVHCGPGETTEAFTEVAVESMTWFGHGSIAMDAFVVCDAHTAGPFLELTGAGPRSDECSFLFTELC